MVRVENAPVVSWWELHLPARLLLAVDVLQVLARSPAFDNDWGDLLPTACDQIVSSVGRVACYFELPQIGFEVDFHVNTDLGLALMILLIYIVE